MKKLFFIALFFVIATSAKAYMKLVNYSACTVVVNIVASESSGFTGCALTSKTIAIAPGATEYFADADDLQNQYAWYNGYIAGGLYYTCH